MKFAPVINPASFEYAGEKFYMRDQEEII